MPDSPTIFVSSSVYGNEDLLDQIYATLTSLGYNVWMSHAGTIPIDSGLTAFQACIHAVEQCDLFLGLISGYYGSGVDGAGNSITHQELSKAIELKKRRWLLVHHDVLTIRNFVKAIRRFEKTFAMDVCSWLELRRHDPISDIRVLAMYEEATLADAPQKDRIGNWVQPYKNPYDILRFVKSQLADPSAHVAMP